MDARTPPLLCRLLTVPFGGGPASADLGAVEARGGGYRPQPVRLAGVDAEHATNADPIRFAAVPGCTATALEVGDPELGVWTIPAAIPQVVPDGADVLIPAGTLRLRLADVALVGTRPATGGAGRAATTVGPPGAVGCGPFPPVGVALGDGASAGSQADTHG